MKRAVLLTLEVLLLGIALGCPPSQLSGPCECIETFGKSFVTCDRMSESEQLVQAFRELNGQEVTALEIKGSNLKHVPYEAFANTRVSRMKIRNTSLFYLFDRPLEGAIRTSLKKLELENVDIDGGLDWTVLNHLRELETVSVVRSSLEQIPSAMAHVKLSKLTTLELDGDELLSVEEKAFHNFKLLTNLVLKNNVLTAFSRNMLPLPSSDLQFLDLRNNHLSALPSNAFEAMPKLHSVLLDGNKFAVLEKAYMQAIWSQLFYFSAYGNPLVCDCRLSWIAGGQRPFHLKGECVAPEALQGTQLADLREGHFGACL